MPAEPTRISYDIAPPTDEAQILRLRDILSDCFNMPLDMFPAHRERVGDKNFRVICDGDNLVGGLNIIPMGQLFGGRSVSMAGVGGVGVHPAWRSKGAASTMMAHVLHEFHRDGFALSTLYPATQPLYRRAGYENAGSRFLLEIDLSKINVRERTLDVVPIDHDDPKHNATVKRLYDECARYRTGSLDRGSFVWSRIRNHRGTETSGYLLCDPSRSLDDAEGYVFSIRQSGAGYNYHIQIVDAATSTERAGSRLLQFLADHRSMAPKVVWYTTAALPIFYALPEQSYNCNLDMHWMLRIVDVIRACEARGYAIGMTGEITFEVYGDEVLGEHNHGSFTLQLDGSGQAKLKQGTAIDSGLRIHINGLAALYSGHQTANDLQQSGLACGTSEELEQASAVFGSGVQSPWMPDMF